MRRCIITDVRVEYETRSRFEAGEPMVTVKLTMTATPDAVKKLEMLGARSVSEISIDTLLGELGADRPDLQRARELGYEQGVRSAARGATAKELATLLLEPDVTSRDKCGELHSSGIACQLPKGHHQHASVKGWKWDEASIAKEEARKGRLPPCGECKAKDVARSEVAVAAGLRGGASWTELLEAVQLLKLAADPPYEPKAKPARSRCPDCGSETIVRLARRTQKEFTGCSAWPACSWVHVPPKPVKPVDTRPGYARRELDFSDDE